MGFPGGHRVDGTFDVDRGDPVSDDGDPVEILCPECDYNLHALTSERCPWCGWEIDVDVLIEDARSNPTARRISAGLTALLVGGLTIAALVALILRSRDLTLFDAAAVLGVGTGALGHFVLGASVLFYGRRFPLRRSLCADLLLVCGGLSLAGAGIGAIQVWDAAPTERVVRGVQVNGIFEFGITALVYALPGLSLLALRAVSYRHAARKASPSRKQTETRGPSGVPTSASFSIDAMQNFDASEITQAWHGLNRPTSPAVERIIRETWETQKALAEQTTVVLFNDDLVRASRITCTKTKLHFELGPTCFRDFLGTNLFNAQQVAKDDLGYLADALGISSIVVTADGFIALGRRNDSVAYHGGFLHMFGGLVDQSDRDDQGSYDLFGAAIRELHEELTVSDREISKIVVIGVVRDQSILQPELLFDVTIGATKAEVLERFDPLAKDQEHTAIEFVHNDPDAVLPFLRRAAPIAAVAEAGLLIHGRNHWGQSWYEQACYVLYGELPATSLSPHMGFASTVPRPEDA